MNLTISRFWLDRAAGKPLGKAWQRKDRRIALENPHDPDLCDMTMWFSFTPAEVQQIEHRLYARDAA